MDRNSSPTSSASSGEDAGTSGSPLLKALEPRIKKCRLGMYETIAIVDILRENGWMHSKEAERISSLLFELLDVFPRVAGATDIPP